MAALARPTLVAGPEEQAVSAARTLTDADLAALLDAKQVAESLRVQPNAVTKMVRRGVLPIAGQRREMRAQRATLRLVKGGR